jgi:glycogen debranching enzyme
MVQFARNLSAMATLLGRSDEARGFASEADELACTINSLMWDPVRRFYFDLTLDGRRSPVRTVAAYWALLGRVAAPGQAAALVAELHNPRTFDRPSGVPTLAADEPGYDPEGGYWRGAVWTPTSMMVIRGLELYGYREDARNIALKDIGMMNQVYRRTGTIWENYAPDSAIPGNPARPDFVGWSGLAPIGWLLEYAIGLKPDAPSNELAWDLRSSRRAGCERYRFNGHVVSLLAQPDSKARGGVSVDIESDGAFTLLLRRGSLSRTVAVHAGTQQVDLTHSN